MAEIKNRKSISASSKYYDDLARAGYTAAKDYQQVLFKPGKALQSRELNFLQSLINEKIKNSNDLVYKNGSIIMGCDVTIDEDTVNTITVGDGVIYWDGTFFKFMEKSTTTSSTVGTGLNVFLVPKYETVDYTVDNKLYDPAILYKINKSIDGADRLKITFDVVIGEDYDDVYTTYPQAIHVGIINSTGVTLINRSPFIVEQDKLLESKIISGLKVRNNPMREPFSINDDNEDFYNTTEFEKSFVEIEEGSGVINGEEIVSSESKVFQLNKNFSTNESDKLIRDEKKIQSLMKDLVGIYGDMSYGENYIDKKTFFADMLQPGKEVKIKVRIPITKTVEGSDPVTEYKIFEVCTAEIADAYDLWKNETYEKIKDDEEPITGIGITPIPIDKIEIDADVTKYNVVGGLIVPDPTTGGYSGAPVVDPNEYTYDTSDSWRVHLISLWKIYLPTGSDIKDYTSWTRVEFMTVINKIFDASGQEVAANGLKLIPQLVNGAKLRPRESVQVKGNGTYPPSDFEYNNSQTLPGEASLWMDSSEDSSSDITFSIDFPASWIASKKVAVKSVSASASNPFIFPGNLLNEGVKGDDIYNICMGGTIKKSYEGKFSIPALDPVLNPINGIAKFRLRDDGSADPKTKINDSEFICANLINMNYYVYDQNNIKTRMDASTLSELMDNMKESDIYTEKKGEDGITIKIKKKCVLFHEFYNVITIDQE